MQKKILSGLALGAMVLGLGYGLISTSVANAIENENLNENSNMNENVNVPPKAYTECLVAAIKVRDASILEAWNTFSGAMVTAYTARPLALEDAWYTATSSKDRVAAVKAAWKSFKDARKTARKTFNRTRYAAWETFKTSRKACPSIPRWSNAYDGGGHGVDSEPTHMDR